MSRGFTFWHIQPLDRVMPPLLANLRPPAMSPHANENRHLSNRFISGEIKGWRDRGKNGPKAKRREWLPGKHSTEHMGVTQARLTTLEPND